MFDGVELLQLQILELVTLGFPKDILKNTNGVYNYLGKFHQYGMVNEINLPTHVSDTTGKCVTSTDHVWHDLSKQRLSHVFSPCFPDYKPVCVVFSNGT